MLSIIIPSYKDRCLQRTIDDIRKHAVGDIEIIAVLDGYADHVQGATIVRHGANRGLRQSVTNGVAISHGEYLLKCDAHCAFAPGFDKALLAEIEDNWIVIPRRYKLNIDQWELYDDAPIDYEKLIVDPDRIYGQPWPSRAKARRHLWIDETPVFQGSCWVMARTHWDRIGGLPEEGYGSFTQEPIQLAMKTWLGGGKVMVNKRTWYGHKHRLHARTHQVRQSEIDAGYRYSHDYWTNNRWFDRKHDFSWVLDRFGLSPKPEAA